MTKVFEESDRLNYHDLTPESVVIDIGAFEGNFALWANDKFHCRVIGFEPVPEFFWQVTKRFEGTPKVLIFPYAVGAKCGYVTMGVKGAMSGEHCSDPNEVVEVRMISIEEAIGYSRVYTPALVSVNAEGAEFEIIAAALASGIFQRIKHWQIQPHAVVEDAEIRWAALHAQMLLTHDLIYHEPWCWSGYTRRDLL